MTLDLIYPVTLFNPQWFSSITPHIHTKLNMSRSAVVLSTQSALKTQPTDYYCYEILLSMSHHQIYLALAVMTCTSGGIPL